MRGTLSAEAEMLQALSSRPLSSSYSSGALLLRTFGLLKLVMLDDDEIPDSEEPRMTGTMNTEINLRRVTLGRLTPAELFVKLSLEG